MKGARLALAIVAASVVGAWAGADEPALVTIGSAIKLEHKPTKHRLHSHDIPYGYGMGSGQQSVTAIADTDNDGGFWVVHAAPGTEAARGVPLKAGDVIRLQHGATRRWLHSHHFSSPISSAQEVSAFGSDEESDRGDLWTLELASNSDGPWRQDESIRLKHVETGVYLSSSAKFRFSRPIPGHLEVAGIKKKTTNALWAAAEGVYFVPKDSS